jgi:hypothetical protein
MGDRPHFGSAVPENPRNIVCERCGTLFRCNLDGDCWCAAESYRLPLPLSGDCLCPACLRQAAACGEV